MRTIGFSASADRLTRGAIAGLAGGVVFGILMQAMGMLPMIAALVGASGVLAGWAVHLAIAAVFGALFGSAVSTREWGPGVGLGLAWGAVLWAVAAMGVMRTVMGTPVALDPPAVASLVGHLLYGGVLGLAYVASRRRAGEGHARRGHLPPRATR